MHSHNTPQKTDSNTEPVSDYFALRNAINIAFIMLTVATVIVYFLWPKALGGYLYMYIGLVAVVIKMVEVVLRMNYNRKKK